MFSIHTHAKLCYFEFKKILASSANVLLQENMERFFLIKIILLNLVISCVIQQISLRRLCEVTTRLSRIYSHFVHKQTFNRIAKLAKWWNCVVSTYLYGALTVRFYHVTYTFRGNIRFVNAWISRKSMLETSSISKVQVATTGIKTHNHLVHKQTVNHLVKLAKRFNCDVITYLVKLKEL